MRSHTLLAGAAAVLALGACQGKGKSTSPPVDPLAAAAAACTGCHGSTGNAAPPRSTKGATSTTDIAVGAHQTHLNPGPFRKAVSCGECHPVPMSVTSPGHNDGKVDVVFGGLATAGGATPAWNPSTQSCSTVYCHGATLPQGPASKNAPVWTVVVNDPTNPASQVACGTCHGIPPPDAVHTGVPGMSFKSPPYTATDINVCSTCHPGTVQSDGSGNGALDVVGGLHIDGVVEIGAAACTRCHGDPSRSPVALTPAPPVDRSGNTATTFASVGAHLAHLTGTTWRGTPVACTECHAVPTALTINGAAVHPSASGATDLTWGSLASAGGAAPGYDKTTPSAPQCTNYCHGTTLVGGSNTRPTWTKVDGTQATCGSCHGLPPTTSAHAVVVSTTNCASCHRGYEYTVGGGPAATCTAANGCVNGVNPATHIDGYVNVGSRTCTSCHGDASRPPDLAPSPPIAANGSSSTSDVGVGAHLTHLLGGPFSRPVACTECHPSVTSTEHANGVVDLVFGPLATTGLSHPTFTPPATGSRVCMPGECTCATNYCHGSTLTGGTDTAPIWTSVGTGQTACGTCHGNPPPPPHYARNDCGSCHAGYTTTTVNLALHIDGKIDATGGACTDCHGDPSRTPATIAPAPPSDAGGATAPWAASDPGAHLKHLAGTLLRAAPIDCAECHSVPTGPPMPPGSGDTHGNGVADVVFGTLANTGVAAAVWVPATLTCATTYCHGATLVGGNKTTPVWNVVDGTQTACGACHGIPPAEGVHTSLAAGTACGVCHAGYGGAVGGAASSFTLNATLHINGTVDATGVSCTSCHGDSTRVLVTGSDAQTAAAPPVDATGSTWATSGTGAHLAHLNKGTGAIGAHVACSECHVVPAGPPGSAGPGDTHGNGVANVSFGTLSKTGGAAPTYNAGSTTVAPSCAASYCHGNYTTTNGRVAIKTAVSWSAAGPLPCSGCHAVNASGVPVPNDKCHPPSFNHDGGNRCQDCHTDASGTTTTPATITNIALHVNGAINGKCTDCHRTPQYPAGCNP